MMQNPVPIRFSLAQKQALQEEADKNGTSMSETVKTLLGPFFKKNTPRSKIQSILRLVEGLEFSTPNSTETHNTKSTPKRKSKIISSD